MNRRMSHGHAMRSVLGRARVIQRMWSPLRVARHPHGAPPPPIVTPGTTAVRRSPDRLGPMQTQRARAIVPLALAVFGFGISFGVLARAAGMGVLSPIVMSATTFAGSAQFAAVSI